MKIASLNVSGIRTTHRIQAVTHYLDKFKIDVLFLQETHIDNVKLRKQIEEQLEGKIYY